VSARPVTAADKALAYTEKGGISPAVAALLADPLIARCCVRVPGGIAAGGIRPGR
jgi:hypothetical protein